MATEFSHRTRARALRRMATEEFDFLVIGGGITGAAVARDAVSRGLSVALVERNDFAFGTSSRSSKLIHGGLRYLENFEFSLVFEALSERAHLLKTVPNLVHPLPFYFPVYRGDLHGKATLGLGMWLYDLLSLFRSPGFHRSLSKKQLLAEIPFLKEDGLKGGYRYFDASMWDDVLAIDTLRSAHESEAAIANYAEAVEPIRDGERLAGFRVRDLENPLAPLIDVRAQRVVICAGPWTDEVASRMTESWKPWVKPSQGIHLVFDLKRLPVPGAMVMSHPTDGRIAFVIPRPDFGSGVALVGTTDTPTSRDPGDLQVSSDEVTYLMGLLRRYFPSLNLTASDILSAYVGVRPLMGQGGAGALQKVSREHHIDWGPGRSVMVVGGKYTTHRRMAREIVDFALQDFPKKAGKSTTMEPVNPAALPVAIAFAEARAVNQGLEIPKKLFDRYGSDAMEIAREPEGVQGDPEGFPKLAGQLRYAIRHEMAMHLEDFYLRRAPLYLSRADHGLPWAETLARVWAEERGLVPEAVSAELSRLRAEVARRSEWAKSLTSH